MERGKIQLKAVAMPKGVAGVLVKIVGLVGLATIFPFLGNQFLTGPLVNAVLFVAVFFLDLKGAVLVGLFPSVIALSMGLLPAVLAPMVPFIMLGNAVLVVAFYYFKEKNYWLGIAVASFFKYVFLYGSSALMIRLVIRGPVAAKVAVMMSWPQLVSALAGGVLAYMFLKTIKRM